MRKLELRLIGSYILWYWVYIILFVIATNVFTTILGRDVSAGAAGAVVSALAAHWPGIIYFKRVNDFPSSGFSWWMASCFFVLQLMFEGLRMSIAFGLNSLTELLEKVFSSSLGLVLVLIFYTVQFLMTWYFFGQGVRIQAKREAKKARAVARQRSAWM